MSGERDNEILSTNHWVLEDFTQRMTVAEWKQVLRNELDTPIVKGNLRRLIAINRGHGFVDVKKEPMLPICEIVSGERGTQNRNKKEKAMDEKWIAALKSYWGGGIVPFWKLPDGTVDAAKTIDHMMRSRRQNKIGANGESLDWPSE